MTNREKDILEIMETHVRNNEAKLLRLSFGIDRVVESSERTESVVSEMVDDVATLRTKAAHMEDDIDELKREMNTIDKGTIYRISGAVVGAAISVAITVFEIFIR